MDASASGAGNFANDTPMTGVPGSNNSTDGLVLEVVTYMELAAGFHTLGVNSDDGFRATMGANSEDVGALEVGIFDTGRAAADTLFSIVAEEEGFYLIRILYWEGDSESNLEFFSVAEDGEKILVNDASNPNAIKAYREAQTRPSITSFSPDSPQLTDRLQYQIDHGGIGMVEGSITLSVDGVDVTAALDLSRPANVTTVTYVNLNGFFSAGNHSAVLSFDENSTPVVTRTFTHDIQIPTGIAAVLLDEPTDYWGLGELSGATVFEEVNEGLDGFYQSLALGDPPVLGVERLTLGAPTPAVRFVATQQNLVKLPDHVAVNNAPSIEDYSIEMWFRADTLPTSEPSVAGETIPHRYTLWDQGGATRSIAIYIVGTQASDPTEADLYFFAFNRGGGSVWNEPPDDTLDPFAEPTFVKTTIQANTVYHVAFVMDGDSEGLEGTIVGYVNGEPVGTAEGIGILDSDHNPGGFGAFNENGGFHDRIINGTFAPGHPVDWYFFDGVIDEVAVFDKPLTSDQVMTHYNGGLEEVDCPTCDGQTEPPTISITANGDGSIAIDFEGVLLQSANAEGPYTVVSDATPPYPVDPPGTAMFYRSQRN